MKQCSSTWQIEARIQAVDIRFVAKGMLPWARRGNDEKLRLVR
ncbi:hypothetical protein Rpal_3835 [Rhodopseudomonas palustris TIE-1]|nr:hypothetical protein Rpal_3835 [Rhodopseudomonas palustris TIE-1]